MENYKKCDCGTETKSHENGCTIWGNGGKCKYCDKKAAQVHGLCRECCPCCEEMDINIHEFFNEEARQRMEKNECTICGVPLVPSLENVIYNGPRKGEWDGHTFKFGCDCIKNKNIRICIG